MWQYILLPWWQDATWSSRTCLYMKLFVQPGNVHLKGPPSQVAALRPETVDTEVLADEVEDEFCSEEAEEEAAAAAAAAAASIGARCFLEICPVSAASEVNVADSHPCQAHLVTPLTRWTALRCFLRSVAEANDAPHTVPHGMSHWHAREVGGAETAERRSAVLDSGVSVGWVRVCGSCFGTGEDGNAALVDDKGGRSGRASC